MSIETVEEALRGASFRLRQAAVDNPRREAELLLAWATGKKPLELLLDRDLPLIEEGAASFNKAVARRCSGEPLAYITGEKEFYGMSFAVNPHVLVPRPETEFVVEAALQWAQRRNLASGKGVFAADMGTGSGVLAITLACRLPAAEVWAVDISGDALRVAAQNAERHGASERINWHCGDFFQALKPLNPPPRFNLVVGNPPYVPAPNLPSLPVTVRDFEPLLALNGGRDGLAAYRALLAGLPRHMLSPGLLALEIGAGQAGALEALCLETGLFESITFQRDYQGWLRVLLSLF